MLQLATGNTTPRRPIIGADTSPKLVTLKAIENHRCLIWQHHTDSRARGTQIIRPLIKNAETTRDYIRAYWHVDTLQRRANAALVTLGETLDDEITRLPRVRRGQMIGSGEVVYLKGPDEILEYRFENPARRADTPAHLATPTQTRWFSEYKADQGRIFRARKETGYWQACVEASALDFVESRLVYLICNTAPKSKADAVSALRWVDDYTKVTARSPQHCIHIMARKIANYLSGTNEARTLSADCKRWRKVSV